MSAIVVCEGEDQRGPYTGGLLRNSLLRGRYDQLIMQTCNQSQRCGLDSTPNTRNMFWLWSLEMEEVLEPAHPLARGLLAPVGLPVGHPASGRM